MTLVKRAIIIIFILETIFSIFYKSLAIQQIIISLIKAIIQKKVDTIKKEQISKDLFDLRNHFFWLFIFKTVRKIHQKSMLKNISDNGPMIQEKICRAFRIMHVQEQNFLRNLSESQTLQFEVLSVYVLKVKSLLRRCSIPNRCTMRPVLDFFINIWRIFSHRWLWRICNL